MFIDQAILYSLLLSYTQNSSVATCNKYLKIKCLLLRASHLLAPSRRFQLENANLRVCLDTSQVLRGNEDELSVLHLGGYFNESLQSKFSRNRVKEDIELIHHSERCLQTFADGEQQRKSGETPFTSTKCLHIFGLGAFISVVLRTEEIQRKRG